MSHVNRKCIHEEIRLSKRAPPPLFLCRKCLKIDFHSILWDITFRMPSNLFYPLPKLEQYMQYIFGRIPFIVNVWEINCRLFVDHLLSSAWKTKDYLVSFIYSFSFLGHYHFFVLGKSHFVSL